MAGKSFISSGHGRLHRQIINYIFVFLLTTGPVSSFAATAPAGHHTTPAGGIYPARGKLKPLRQLDRLEDAAKAAGITSIILFIFSVAGLVYFSLAGLTTPVVLLAITLFFATTCVVSWIVNPLVALIALLFLGILSVGLLAAAAIFCALAGLWPATIGLGIALLTLCILMFGILPSY